MNSVSTVTLTRDCAAVQIPAGHPVTLPAGSEVDITQTLGGTYTVHAQGGLFRIAGKDADALGLKSEETPAAAAATNGEQVSEQMVWETLRTCYDPEIPVNIVDLGLIYDCAIEPLGENEYKVSVKMTLTAPGCGMGPVLQQDVQNKLLGIDPVQDVQVELVWDPPWNQGMLTEAARLQLGLM